MSKLVTHIFLHFHGRTIKHQFFQLCVCFHQNRSARSLIYATGLHTYNTVFNDINDTDTMFAAKCVELADDVGYLHFFAVDAYRNTFFEFHSDILTFVRGLFRCNAENQKMIVVRFIGRILQFQTFVA